MKYKALIVAAMAAVVLAGCGGGGSSAPATTPPVATTPTPPVTAPVDTGPKPVLYATSYQNAKAQNLGPVTLPQEAEWSAAYARADFKGDGTAVLFAAWRKYNNTKPLEQAVAGEMAFYVQGRNGVYAKQTGMLETNVSCIEPRKAVVADFNQDKKPDIILACTGYDAKPFPGEKMMIVESTASGVYRVRSVGNYVGFFHGAAAADLDNDGLIDLVTTDGNSKPIRVFKNTGNAQFTELENAVPASLPAGYYSVELVDVNGDGAVDLLAGGHEYEGVPTRVFLNPGRNYFANADTRNLPAVTGAGVVLDFVVQGRTLYIGRTNGGETGFYTRAGLQSVNLDTLTTIDSQIKNIALPIWYIPAANGVVSDRTDRPF